MHLVITLFVLCQICSGVAWAEDSKPVNASNVTYAFNSGTGAGSVNYTLDNGSDKRIVLQVTDMAGEAVRIIDDGIQGPGRYSILWNGTDDLGRLVPDGRYNATVYGIDGFIETPRFLLTRPLNAIFQASGLKYYPSCPAIDESGNIYVTDGRHDRVWKYDCFGNLLTGWGSTGTGDGQFNSPSGIAIDSQGDVYVVDTLNDRVQKFSDNGSYIRQWGSSGMGSGQFSSPSGIAIDRHDRVFVSDTRNNRIETFDDNGTFVSEWGSYGGGNGQLDGPGGIAVDLSGNVYVADTYNNRIALFDSSGSYAGECRNYGGRELNLPEGVAVTEDGRLLVVDSRNTRALEINADGTIVHDDEVPDLAGYSTDVSNGDIFAMNDGYMARLKTAGIDDPQYIFLPGNSDIVARSQMIVDRTPPVISIMAPVDGARYYIDYDLTVLWCASDDGSGIRSATGVLPSGTDIDTSTPGEYEFSVKAIDNAGNEREQVCVYQIESRKVVTSPGTVSTVTPKPTVTPVPTVTPAPTGSPTPKPTPKPKVTPTPVPTPPPDINPPRPIGATVDLIKDGGSTATSISAELATTGSEINMGLMYRPSLSSGRGMLFVFGGDQSHTFTMANMNFPIDIIFIKSDMTILNIRANAQPGSTGISSGGACKYVLEVNAGLCASKGIHAGNKVKINWL